MAQSLSLKKSQSNGRIRDINNLCTMAQMAIERACKRKSDWLPGRPPTYLKSFNQEASQVLEGRDLKEGMSLVGKKGRTFLFKGVTFTEEGGYGSTDSRELLIHKAEAQGPSYTIEVLVIKLTTSPTYLKSFYAFPALNPAGHILSFALGLSPPLLPCFSHCFP